MEERLQAGDEWKSCWPQVSARGGKTLYGQLNDYFFIDNTM